eukprot:gene9594-1796_t
MQRTILKNFLKNQNGRFIKLRQIRNYSNNDGFFNLWKSEIKKNLEKEKELQESLKEVSETKTVQAIKKTSETVSELKKKTSETVSSTVKPIKEKVTETKTKITESEAYKKTSETVGKVSETVSENKAVKFVVDDFSQGDLEKQKHHFNFRSEFKRKKDLEEGIYYNPYTEKIEKLENQQVNTETGELVVSKKREKKEVGLYKTLNDLAISMEEKSNPVSMMAKAALKSSAKVVGFFENTVFKSTELGEILTDIKEIDPTFDLQDFLYHVEHTLIPTVLDAYYKDDVETLQCYLSKKCIVGYIKPRIKEREFGKVKFDTRILNITNINLMTARYIGEDPVLVIAGSVQYIHCLKNEKGEIVEGAEDDIREESHMWVLQQDATHETRDWEVQEVSFGGNVRVV